MNISKHGCAFAVLSTFVALAGCSASTSEPGVRAQVDITNQTKSALAAGSITAVHGTYGGACIGHPGGLDTWTVVATGPGTDLSVVKDDTACTLAMRSIEAGGETYIGTPAIDMTGSWKGTASAFSLDGDPANRAFYGNAKMSATSFAADFLISVLVSDAPNASNAGEKNANYTSVSGSVAAATVPASDYEISFDPFDVQKNAANVVESSAGFAQLGDGTSFGEDYAIYNGALDGTSSLAAVEAAYAGATQAGLLSDLTTLQLPAAFFAIDGVDLDSSPQRTVIIRHTDRAVSSYQLLLVTFRP